VKWYKHLSGSLNDSLIFEAIEKFGSDGYLVFFGVLELMADEFDIYNPGKNIISLKKITKNLQLSRQKTVKILSFFNEKAKINKYKNVSFFAEVIHNDVYLNCPRLKELTDEYTQKQLKNLSGQKHDSSRDKLRSKEAEAETEVDNKEEKKERNIPLPTEYHSPHYQEKLPEAKQVLSHLNKVANKNYPENYGGIKLIMERLFEGETAENLIIVIDKKMKDPDFNRNYIRPETLFKKENFTKYLHEEEKHYGRKGTGKSDDRYFKRGGNAPIRKLTDAKSF